MTPPPSGGYRAALDKVSFGFFLLSETWWVLACWNAGGWPDDKLDRVETIRITCQAGAAVAALLAGRRWLFAQEVTGLFWPWVGLGLAGVEAFRRVRRFRRQERAMDDWEGVDAALARFGLPARAADRDEIARLLREEIRREWDGRADHLLMRVLCAQLFSIGRVEDSLLVWEAKSSGFDPMCGIDVQFLCGAGLEETKGYLRAVGTDPALAARDYIIKCEAADDFADFSVDQVLGWAKHFYRVA